MWLGVGYQSLTSTFAWPKESNKNHTQPPHRLTVMNWNVANFHVLAYNRNDSAQQEMIKCIRSKNPDVLCLQEFVCSHTDSGHYTLNYFKEALQMPYVRYFYTPHQDYINYHHFGKAIFSKYPFVDSLMVTTNQKKYTQYFNENDEIGIATIKINNDSIRIINYHGQTWLFNQHPSLANNWKNLDTNFIRRKKQCMTLDSIVQTTSLKTILCGDFNEPPTTYHYKLLTTKLQDSFSEKGFGFGFTFGSIIRLDKILYSKPFEVNSFQIGPEIYSDHRAVTVQLVY